MVDLATRERIDIYWSKTLGVEPVDLHAPGVRVGVNRRDGQPFRVVYILTFDKAANVFAPADLVGPLTEAASGMDADAALDPSAWSGVLGNEVRVAFGPVVHHYLDDATGLAAVADGRRINPLDADALDTLRAAVPPGEWRSAGFTATPAMLFGIFEGDSLLAVANLTDGPDVATDVGLVLHPDARGRGLAVRIAAAAAKQAIAMHGVARFRALEVSAPTMAIAAKLGFTEYGRNLALYLGGVQPA